MKEENNHLKAFGLAITERADSIGLITDEEGCMSTVIIDEELDTFDVTFNYDGCATIDTEGMSYIVLSTDLLHELIELIEVSESRYNNESENRKTDSNGKV